ncbi:TVP38/TMEM64 family protein [Sporotomaculum syntrophicum]|uniref:TVP38/TMEM64 family protein n=1 Tax=Sporotomaculum syntrophicum TaxID=182264 RepID=UPI001FAD983D|nr:TVP38/TMEM64 family protein [Sporotomaculum syntrophicum]
MKNIFRGYQGKILFLAVLGGIYFLVPWVKIHVNQAFFILSNVDVEMVRGYILSFGIWAPVVSFVLMMFQSVAAPLPAFIITFANAGLFGWVYGAILSWSSAMAGAVLCFYIARYLGRDTVVKFTSVKALKSVDDFFEHYGKYAILIARLLPFVSFDIVSYAAGLTAMGFWPFFIATGVGQLPATIVYSYIGGMLTGSVRTMVFGLLMLFALSALLVLLKNVWKDKKLKEGNKFVEEI